jgi:ATP-dependent Clp protease ATP-binding subunit ClpC
MFERYTEKARRVIFFARYEASQFGSPYIETEHMLLGVLREDRGFTLRFVHGQSGVEAIRAHIDSATTKGKKVSTSVDLPLSNECKRVLAYAAEEAERLAHKYIETQHLALGLLREEKCFAAQLLKEHGVQLSALRKDAAQATQAGDTKLQADAPSGLSPFIADLNQTAVDKQLHRLVGRENEIQRLVHVLGRSDKNNPVLVGEPGVGKRTIVAGLAQRIAEGEAPSLAEDRVLSLDLSLLVAGTKHSQRPAEFLNDIAGELLAASANVIFFVDELHALLASNGAHEVLSVLKPALQSGRIQCIAAATPEEYRNANQKALWLESCFWPVEVAPATEEEAIQILLRIKERYEKFHSVAYTEDAITSAVKYSNHHNKDRCLPEKAIDLIDDAGAYVKLHRAPAPEEIREARKRIKVIMQWIEKSVTNHEFEKARFYSDEESKLRANLHALEKKHGIDESVVEWVTRDRIEEALARWTGLSVEAISRESQVSDAGAQPASDVEKKKPASPRKKSAKKKDAP